MAIGLSLSAFSSLATASCVSSSTFISASGVAYALPAASGVMATSGVQAASTSGCFGTTSPAAASQSINSTVFQQMVTIFKSVGARMAARQDRADSKISNSGQQIGLAAGDLPSMWNSWGSVSGDRNKYDRGGYVNAAGTISNNQNNIDVTNAVLGGDYQISPATALGLSVAFDSGSGTIEQFNAGVSGGATNQSTRGYSIAPYIGWQINRDWSLDATFGFGRGKTDTGGIKGDTDRLFYGTTLGYATWNGSWQLTGRGGYLHGEEKAKDLTAANGTLLAGTAATNKIDNLRLEAQAGYAVNDNAIPYFGLSYSNDLHRSTTYSEAEQLGSEIGKSALVWALGVNFYSTNKNMTGGIAYNQESNRTYTKNNSIMANINYRF